MGYRLSKIYTRTGDGGETGLADGRRVTKDHPRVDAMGEVDTLNSQIGLLLADMAEHTGQWPGLTEIIEVLAPCQHRLFDLGGELAMPDYQALQAPEIERLETAIDRWNEEVGPLENFILPGGSKTAALCHMARSVCRRAERCLVALNKTDEVNATGRQYLNRLSDFLFVMARLLARRNGGQEVLWLQADKR